MERLHLPNGVIFSFQKKVFDNYHFTKMDTSVFRFLEPTYQWRPFLFLGSRTFRSWWLVLCPCQRFCGRHQTRLGAVHNSARPAVNWTWTHLFQAFSPQLDTISTNWNFHKHQLVLNLHFNNTLFKKGKKFVWNKFCFYIMESSLFVGCQSVIIFGVSNHHCLWSVNLSLFVGCQSVIVCGVSICRYLWGVNLSLFVGSQYACVFFVSPLSRNLHAQKLVTKI